MKIIQSDSPMLTFLRIYKHSFITLVLKKYLNMRIHKILIAVSLYRYLIMRLYYLIVKYRAIYEMNYQL